MFKAKLLPYNETLPITNNKTERAMHKKEDNFRFEHSGYYKLIDHGTYSFPAWKRYGRKTAVFCDRCHRQNLRAAVGYSQFDLCLLCVDELTRLNYDCPSRHCHESKFINDNSVSFSQSDYIDLNRYYTYQKNNIVDNNINNKNNNKKINIETFGNINSADNYNFIIIFIIIIFIIVFIYLFLYDKK
jgi:hypothetical protein